MSMTTLLGLSFGVFPCLLFGFIMLLSLLLCEYIEEYVAKHLCAWKNSRRRRGLRSFYRDYRDRRQSERNERPSPESTQLQPAIPSTSAAARSRTQRNPNQGQELLRLLPAPQPEPTFPPTAPPQHPPPYPITASTAPLIRSYQASIPFPNDPPPSYEECVLPRLRLFQGNTIGDTGSLSSNSSGFFSNDGDPSSPTGSVAHSPSKTHSLPTKMDKDQF